MRVCLRQIADATSTASFAITRSTPILPPLSLFYFNHPCQYLCFLGCFVTTTITTSSFSHCHALPTVAASSFTLPFTCYFHLCSHYHHYHSRLPNSTVPTLLCHTHHRGLILYTALATFTCYFHLCYHHHHHYRHYHSCLPNPTVFTLLGHSYRRRLILETALATFTDAKVAYFINAIFTINAASDCCSSPHHFTQRRFLTFLIRSISMIFC